MPHSIRPRYLAVAVAAGLVLTATAGGVGFAAGSSATNVSACVNSKGRLGVQNSKGKCPKKYKKVSIAKQGPRGATGANGAAGGKGVKGDRGPGAVAYDAGFVFAAAGPSVAVDGVTYGSSCSVSGTGAGRTVVTHLTITGQPGKSVSLRGIRNNGDPTGPATATAFVESSATTIDHTLLANGNQPGGEWLTGALVESGTSYQTLNLHLVSYPNDGVGPFLPIRCTLEGTITPAA